MKALTSTVSHRRIWQLAIPIILANLTVPLVGAVDTAVVGHLSEPHHIGAIALGALIFSFLFWGFGFLRMGTTGFVALAHGRGDEKETRLIFHRGLVMAGLLGLALILLQWPAIKLALWLLDGSERVEAETSAYFHIRVWSAPAVLCVYVAIGVLIGLQRTGSILLVQGVLNLTNMGLDLLFVSVLDWGVPGVAWATLTAEYLAAAVSLYILRDKLASGSGNSNGIGKWKDYTALIRANTNIFIRTLCLIFSFAWFTAQGAKLGETMLAANAILLHFMTMMAFSLDGFAQTAEALAGSAYGARKRNTFIQCIQRTTLWAGLCALLYTLVYALWGSRIISWFSGIDDVTLAAGEYLPWVIAAPLLSVWSYQLDGIFIGTSRTRDMRNAMLVSTFAYLGLTLLTVSVYGNHGLWLSLMILMLLRAATLGYYLPGLIRSVDTH